MLIVEGPDGSGKTTLVKQLALQLGWPIAPRVVNPDTTISGDRTTLKYWVDHNLECGYQRKIFDRHRLISEPIYGPLVRGELQDGFDDANWHAGAWDKLLNIKPFVIFCLPPFPVVRENCLTEIHNHKFTSFQVKMLYQQYWTLAARMPWPALRYDYTNTTNRIYPLSRIVDLVDRHTRKVSRWITLSKTG